MAASETVKRAIVTGAGQGIGRGVALALAGDGYAVGLVGRTKEKLDDTAGAISAQGGTATVVVADLKDAQQVSEAVDQMVAAIGPPTVLVNNAHEFCFGPLADLDLDELNSGWLSGPVAALRMMRSCRPHLCQGGSIVNIGSGAVLDPPPGIGGYAAAKAALHTLTRVAALEWAADGIRANLVLPVALTPPMEAAFAANPTMREQLVAGIPLGRIGDPEGDIGRVVAFLCGPTARYITGATISVDGGESYLR